MNDKTKATLTKKDRVPEVVTETATITADGVTAQLGAVSDLVNDRLFSGFPPILRMYKAVVEYRSGSGDEARETLYCQATSFIVAKDICSNTHYITKLHGHLVSLGEINGVYVE